MIEVKEILRLWLEGRSLRKVTELAAVDRKTVRRYVAAAEAAGVRQDCGAGQLSDELIGQVVSAVRPDRPRGVGPARESLSAHREQIQAWLNKDVTLTKVHVLLARRGLVVPYRTLHRYAVDELGFGRRRPTVLVADGDPGVELQVDFGRLGLIPDPARGARRVTHGLLFTAVYSRHMFIFPTHRQTLDEVIAGFEAAWAFFSGVFKVIVPDSMKAIVDQADNLDPRLNDAFREYAQARGFAVDPARIRRPQDKPRVEKCVQYVRSSFFAGEELDLADCRARPAEVFTEQEAALLLTAPDEPFEIPGAADRDQRRHPGPARYRSRPRQLHRHPQRCSRPTHRRRRCHRRHRDRPRRHDRPSRPGPTPAHPADPHQPTRGQARDLQVRRQQRQQPPPRTQPPRDDQHRDTTSLDSTTADLTERLCS